ncbi:LCP family protein [Mobilicoccus massiliensis]|uniref:LCP family protein n=1 Tax=Mobilicoccus massiliensis TaxID=1522310 RepID=UPI0009E438DF|nr:LCP family protein [Mobilicoccus massiliensis]
MSSRHDDRPVRRERVARDDDPIVVRRGASALSDADALPPRLRRRRALTLVLLTLVAPGSAQIVAGNRSLGRFALRTAVLVVGLVLLAGVTYFLSPATLLGIVTAPWFLGVLVAALVLGALFWAFLFLDAMRLARLSRVGARTRRLVAFLTALLIFVTGGALLTGAWLVWAGRTAVTSVFNSQESRGPVKGRYNVLLIGSDAGSNRTGVRTDTLMLASVDASSGRSALFGFARDTENIDFRPGSTMARLMPQGWNCGDQCLLNGLYQWGMEHRDQFPPEVKNPGAEATKEAVEALSGLDIQYYAMVDLVGFRRFVDAVGGIDVVVGKRTPMGGGTSKISGYIEPGRQRLDGYHALWYARSREGASNYDRMARQKCVMTAMLHQLDPQTVILKAQDIAAISGGVVETDIPNRDLGRLGAVAMKARDGEMTTVNFTPPLIDPWRYDPQKIRDIVAKTIDGDPNPTGKKSSSSSGTATPRSTGTKKQTGAPTGVETPQPKGEGAAQGGDYSFSVSDASGLICAVP